MENDLLQLFNELKDNRDSLYKMIEGPSSQSNTISIRKSIEDSIKTDILLRLKVKEHTIQQRTRTLITEKKDDVIVEQKLDVLKEEKEEDTFIPSINIRNASFSDHSSIKTKKL